MTLSPVFRSPDAVRLLAGEGVWARLAPAAEAQARAVARLLDDLEDVIGAEHRISSPPLPSRFDASDPGGLAFLQDYFFLILFRSLFESLGVSPGRLRFYAELNFCIKGTITAADNLFDDQGKSLLPLDPGKGHRFLSILQLMCFERLIRRSCDRAVGEGVLTPAGAWTILKGLLDLMAEIGELEGSEEGGVREVLDPDTMLERVHRVRGGALFALAFVAPRVLESGEVAARLEAAEPAVARLGTAFQIVDDLTDFEFDLGRRSHNLLVSRIHHHGSPAERDRLRGLLEGGPLPLAGEVEETFRGPAREVLEMAYAEARAAFTALEALGFWFPSRLSDEVVRAIVGLEGVARMAVLAGREG